MKKAICLVFISTAAICLSCNNNASGGRSEQLQNPNINSSIQPFSSDTVASVNNETISVMPNTTSSQPGQVTKGLNPAHGQPGHRCDIAVGAPLDSKPSANTSVTTQPTTTTTPISAPATPPLVIKPGINPAHGQPGHRCDIPVGSPLDSKPATTTTVTPTTVTPVLEKKDENDKANNDSVKNN